MKLCDYGCGQEAKYQFKNGKWCCSVSHSKCNAIKLKVSKNNAKFFKGKKRSKKTIEKISNSHKGKIHSNETREKISKNNAKFFKGKKRSKITIRKMSYSIEKIKEKYLIFSSEEEMRYNLVKPGEKEIQVHCKNHNCPNSKEKGGWFTPTKLQIYHRINNLENEDGNGGSYFYCSEECKQECPLFNLKSDPFRITELPYTSQEYQIWRTEVFKRQEDEYGYNFCEYCETQENLEAHHIEPVKLQPGLSLDLENGLICCKSCHLNKAHIDECSTSNLASIQCKN